MQLGAKWFAENPKTHFPSFWLDMIELYEENELNRLNKLNESQ